MDESHVILLECSLSSPQTSIPGRGPLRSRRPGKEYSERAAQAPGWADGSPAQLQASGELCFLEAPLKSLTEDRTQGSCLVRGQGVGGLSSCAGLLGPQTRRSCPGQPHQSREAEPAASWPAGCSCRVPHWPEAPPSSPSAGGLATAAQGPPSLTPGQFKVSQEDGACSPVGRQGEPGPDSATLTVGWFVRAFCLLQVPCS